MHLISVNFGKVRLLAHAERRRMRDREFAPHDDIIAKRIPGAAEQEAEAARQAIRDKYAQIQIQIDNAESFEEMKAILASALK